MTTPRRMIVVDDDPKVRLLLERAFRAPEFETHAFPTGKAALARVAQIQPDCVVSDILMPDMDGESLLRALRAVPGLERVPFIALSAVRSEARIRAVVGAGADAFLLKPFPLRELTDKVRSLIERPQAARQIRGPLGEDMQPTRPVMKASHTMSTTSLRRRTQQTQPALAPKAPLAASETGAHPVARSRDAGPPLILEPSAVRLADPEPDPEPPELEPPELEPPDPEPPELEPPELELGSEPEPAPPQPTAAEPAPEPEPAPVVRMAGPVRVLTSGRPAGETAPRTRPMPSVRVQTGPPVPAESEARRIELGPKDQGLGFGRFTRVESRGRSFVVLTEAVATAEVHRDHRSSPRRACRCGRSSPRCRTRWRARRTRDTVRRQLDLQHDDTLRRLDDLVLDERAAARGVVRPEPQRRGRRPGVGHVGGGAARRDGGRNGRDGAPAAPHPRDAPSSRRTRCAPSRSRPFARVVVDPEHAGRLPRRAVRAVGGWCRAFATAALQAEAGRDRRARAPGAPARLAEDSSAMGFYDRLARRAKA